MKILGGTFTITSGKDGVKVVKEKDVDPFMTNAVKQITSGKCSTAPTDLPAGYTSTQDGTYYAVAKEVPKPVATVAKDETGTVTKIDAAAAVNSSNITTQTAATVASSVELKLKANSEKIGDIITLTPVSGNMLSITANGVVTGPIAAGGRQTKRG